MPNKQFSTFIFFYNSDHQSDSDLETGLHRKTSYPEQPCSGRSCSWTKMSCLVPNGAHDKLILVIPVLVVNACSCHSSFPVGLKIETVVPCLRPFHERLRRTRFRNEFVPRTERSKP